MYTKTILDRFQNPRNAGGMHGANAIGQVENSACGDIIKMYLKIDDNSIIENAKFKTCGCCVAISASDIACDLIKGKTIDDALKVSSQDISKILGDIPQYKMHCVILAEESIRSAVEDFYKQKEKATKAAIRKTKRQIQEQQE